MLRKFDLETRAKAVAWFVITLVSYSSEGAAIKAVPSRLG